MRECHSIAPGSLLGPAACDDDGSVSFTRNASYPEVIYSSVTAIPPGGPIDRRDRKGSGMTKAVIFDVGGVLIEWHPKHLYLKLLKDEAERQ